MARQNDGRGKMRLLLTSVTLFAIPIIATEPVKEWTPDDPCPTTIRAVIPDTYHRTSAFGTYASVHEAMQICPNIKELRMANLGVSCVDHPDGYNLPFKLDGKERYLSAPEVLSFSGYDFNFNEWHDDLKESTPTWASADGLWPQSSSTNSYIKWAVDMFYHARWHWELRNTPMGPRERSARRWYEQRHTPIERRDLNNVQLWLEAMDFSKVHTLSMTDYMIKPKAKALFQDLPRALTGLKTLRVDGTWVTAVVETFEDDPYNQSYYEIKEQRESILPPARDFITAVHPLESLVWTRSGTIQDDVFEPIIKRHGPTLKHLEWTNTELRFKNRPILSVEQIRNLGKWAPGLRNLTIDLDRTDGTWPWKHLKAIADSMPNLTNLTIYLDMHDRAAPPKTKAKKDLLAKPFLTEKAALDIFHILNLFKTGDKLQNIQLRQGDWAGSWDECTWGAEWMEGKKIWANCSMVEERGVMKPRCEEGHAEEDDFEW